jgi:hypothetical protein
MSGQACASARRYILSDLVRTHKVIDALTHWPASRRRRLGVYHLESPENPSYKPRPKLQLSETGMNVYQADQGGIGLSMLQ